MSPYFSGGLGGGGNSNVRGCGEVPKVSLYFCFSHSVENGSMRIVFKSLIVEVLKQLIKLCSTFYIRFDFYS